MIELEKNIKTFVSALKNEPFEIVLRNILKKIGFAKRMPKRLADYKNTYGIPSLRFEVLIHPSVFNPDFYCLYYPDLAQYKNNKRALLRHWVMFGYKEKRVASPAFDMNFYISAYKDVKNYYANDTYRAIAHWVNHGIKEERIGSFLFDQKFYGCKNKDIQKYVNGNSQLYFTHWLNYGIKENRVSSPFIDINQYIQNKNFTKKKSNLGILVDLYKYGIQKGENFTDSITFQHWPSNEVSKLYTTNYEYAKKYLVDNFPYFKKHDTRKYITINGHSDYSLNKSNVILLAHVVSNNIYGSERSFLDLVSNIDQNKFNIHVCIPYYNKKYIDLLSENCHKVIYFPYKWWTHKRAFDKTTVDVFKAIFTDLNIDLVHSNTIMLLDPIKAAKELNIVSLIHVREIISKDKDLINLFELPVVEIIELVKSTADLLIVNSNSTKEEFEIEDKTYLLYNTIDESFYQPSEIKIPQSNFKVGMLSSNIPKKGIFDFVSLAKAFYKLDPSVEFVLAGEKTKWVQEFEKEIALGKIKANLNFPGYVTDTKSLLDELHVVVNFSHFAESFGRTVIEGMSRGVVPIVYNYGAVSELFIDKLAGYKIDYKRWKQAIPLIKEMLSNSKHYTSMSKLAREGSLRFSPINFKSKLNSIYNKIVEKRISTHYSQKDYASFDFEQYSQVTRLDPLLTHECKEKLSIAYFVYHFPVPSETFVINEIKYLIENGYDVKVYCKGTPYKDFKLDFHVDRYVVKNHIELASLFKEHEINAAHSIFTFPTVTEYLWPACEEAEIPFTFAAHAAGIFKYENIEKNRISEIVNSKFCLRVNVPGQFHKEFLIKKNVPEFKIVINPQVIDNEIYLGYSKDNFKKNKSVCSIGRFVEKKGYEYLIKAAQIFAKDGITLNLYGYGELEEDYKKIIEEYDLQNVFLKGGLKGTKEIIQAFENNDVFIQPSVRASNGDMDGIPTILIEAMSYGIPVLTTAVSSIPELVQNKINGFFIEQSSPESISTVLKSFYTMSNLEISTIVENAKNKVDSFFDIESLMRQNIRIWEGRSLDVVIVTYNNPDHLKEVLKRLILFTKTKIYITIFDNFSDELTRAFLRNIESLYPHIDVIFHHENLFVGPGTNHAIANGSSEYIVYVCGKEGMVIKEGWERNIYDNFDQNLNVGLSGTLGYSPSYLYGKQYPHAIKQFDKFRAKEYVLSNPDKIMRHIQGGLFAMRRAMIEDIGGFSTEVPHNYTDVEFTAYVESSKWEINNLPGVLALFNKTKPGLHSRLDETIYFAHPPQIEDLRLIDVNRVNNKGFCNVCERVQKKEFDVCIGCTSTANDRTIYRYVSESIFSFRRLKSIYINPSPSLEKFWRKSFQGRIESYTDLVAGIDKVGSLKNKTGTFDIALLQNFDLSSLDNERLVDEIIRCLNKAAELLFISQHIVEDVDLAKLKDLFERYDIVLKKKVVYPVALSNFNNSVLYVFKFRESQKEIS